MRIIVKKVGKKPEIVEVENDLKVFKEIVDGYIEILPLFDNAICVCNEEGKLKNLPANFIFGGDVIVGDVFFCAAGEEDFESLNEAQVNVIMNAMTSVWKTWKRINKK